MQQDEFERIREPFSVLVFICVLCVCVYMHYFRRQQEIRYSSK